MAFIIVDEGLNQPRKRIYKTVKHSDCAYINLAKINSHEFSKFISAFDTKILAFIPAGKFLSKANQIRLIEYASIGNEFWGWFARTNSDNKKFKIMADRFNFNETGLFLTQETFFSIGGEELKIFTDFKFLYRKLNARLVPQKVYLPLVNMNRFNKP
ncbi:MAG: hypothetical protein VW146_05155 [Gammaproteobacteria bacterium]